MFRFVARQNAVIKALPKSGNNFYSFIMIVNICAAGLTIAQRQIEKIIFQDLFDKKYDAISFVLFAFICTFVFTTLLGYVGRRLTIKSVQNNVQALKQKIFNTAMHLPIDNKSKRDDALSVMASDAEELAQFIPVSLLGFYSTVITFVAHIALCFFLSPAMTIVALVLILPSVLIEKIYTPHIEKQYQKLSVSDSGLRSFIQESIQAIDVIKIFTLQTPILKKVENMNVEYSKNKIKHVHLTTSLFALGNMLSYIPIFGVFATGCFLYIKGSVSLASMIVCLGAIEGGLVWPASNFLQQITDLTNKTACFTRVESFLEPAKTNVDDEYKIEQGGAVSIFLNKINFSYYNETMNEHESLQDIAKKNELILKEINLKINNNEHICITGESGTGKSTLINIIMEFLKPNSGLVSFNYNNAEYKSYAKNLIAFVPQTSALFMDTIYENIKLGNTSASKEQVIEAAIKAGAHGFIMETEKGYDTIVGGKDSKLSGGQAQRITIARAILKASPILIMDEPSSALDIETEKVIIDLIKNYTGIVVYISHRNELIKAADKVYKLDNGILFEDTERGAI